MLNCFEEKEGERREETGRERRGGQGRGGKWRYMEALDFRLTSPLLLQARKKKNH